MTPQAMGVLCVLSVVDNFTRECLALKVDESGASLRVTRVLDSQIAQRGAPKALLVDSGPELTPRDFLAWCLERNIATNYIRPGKPMQNAHIKSSNGCLRDECLNANRFCKLFDARGRIANWRHDYNSGRHTALCPIEHRTLAQLSGDAMILKPKQDASVRTFAHGYWKVGR